jgi:hypothetical protein
LNATPTDCCESKESATKCGKCEDTACASGNAGISAPLGCKTMELQCTISNCASNSDAEKAS